MNKSDKQNMIIDKATTVFLKKGLFKTVMDDIASEVGLTRRTLYRHFKTKEDIAYEVAIKFLVDWNNFSNEVYLSLEGNAINKMEKFFNLLIDYMRDRKSVMRFLGEFDFYFKDDPIAMPAQSYQSSYAETSLEWDTMFTRLIKEGIKDGSIKGDTNIGLMEATISKILWGFGQRIAIRGDAILKETGFDSIDLIKNQVSIYIKVLRSEL